LFALRAAAVFINLDLLSEGVVEADLLGAAAVALGGGGDLSAAGFGAALFSVEGLAGVFGSGDFFSLTTGGFSTGFFATGAAFALDGGGVALLTGATCLGAAFTGFAAGFFATGLATTFGFAADLGTGFAGAFFATGLDTGFLATGLLAFTGFSGPFLAASLGGAAFLTAAFLGSAFLGPALLGDAFLTDFVAIGLSAPWRLAAPVRFKWLRRLGVQRDESLSRPQFVPRAYEADSPISKLARSPASLEAACRASG
jgi:hypothetical protein